MRATRVRAKADEDHPQADWRSTPFYAVGPSTASCLASIAVHAPTLARLCPTDIRGGAETGTAELLARFILRDADIAPSARLLYLTGDKNRETLPALLDAGEVALRTLQVYATRGAAGFEGALVHVLESVPEEKREQAWWDRVLRAVRRGARHTVPARAFRAARRWRPAVRAACARGGDWADDGGVSGAGARAACRGGAREAQRGGAGGRA
ncbi:hypothetical protein EVG20_g11338 [Dentipellis fragilis]|uniref:Tetrapyrrole biosynthesis uroporphyrinogen III synthase domain-containing protein n=1 Tax=Dentipellis fragilis TaxID=205917 RepID=A0A4Y9XM11_9AGAM|nr:hypothetical protein EVG20_g11338 [Dentipellis fragilis]